MTIGERIDKLLFEKGWSRRKLAVIAGIPASTLQSALARHGSMTVGMVEKISAALECSPAWLCGWNDKEETKQ